MKLPLFHRWHPTLALRYLPMKRFIDKSDSLIEIGSGSLGIGPYIHRKFTGVDIDFSGPVWPDMRQIKASATKIPAKNNSYDIVINSDMLEHLPAKDRQKAINEMMRIAKNTLIIGVPIGRKAHQQDKDLDKEYKKVHGTRHQFLEEQTEYGLPEVKDITDAIGLAAKKASKDFDITIIPNMNLSMRMWLMKGWISKNLLINIFFRKVLLLAIPLMRLYNQEPVYRKLFIVKIDNT